MRRWTRTMLTACLLWGAAGSVASAQFNLGQPPPRVRPTVSPMINMGAGGAYSYYGYVKPQTDAYRSIMDLRQTLTQLGPDGMPQAIPDPQSHGAGLGGLQTGHSATFFNTGSYFPTTLPGSGPTLGGPVGIGSGLGGYGSGIAIIGTAGPGGSRVFFPGTLTPGIRP